MAASMDCNLRVPIKPQVPLPGLLHATFHWLKFYAVKPSLVALFSSYFTFLVLLLSYFLFQCWKMIKFDVTNRFFTIPPWFILLSRRHASFWTPTKGREEDGHTHPYVLLASWLPFQSLENGFFCEGAYPFNFKW